MKTSKPNFSYIDINRIKRLKNKIISKNELSELTENPLITSYDYNGIVDILLMEKNLLKYYFVVDGRTITIYVENN